MKRLFVKYIRDKAKKAYVKATRCEICDSTVDLDLHHYFTVHLLVERWLKVNNITPPETEAEVLQLRDAFIADHVKELYDDTVTLCNVHHKQLHKIYGGSPALTTALKQQNWVVIQKNKNHGK